MMRSTAPNRRDAIAWQSVPAQCEGLRRPTRSDARDTSVGVQTSRLFYFGLLEQDVLAGDRIEFFELEFGGLGPRVFLCDIVETGVSAADQLDQHSVCLGHRKGPSSFNDVMDRKIAIGRLLSRRARSA